MVEHKLEGLVRGANRLHATVNRLWAELIEILRPYERDRILKENGRFVPEIDEKIYKKTGWTTISDRISYETTQDQLLYRVEIREKCCGEDCGGCVFSVAINVGRLYAGILISLAEPEQFREDYTVEWVVQTRREFAETVQKAADLLEELGSFRERNDESQKGNGTGE